MKTWKEDNLLRESEEIWLDSDYCTPAEWKEVKVAEEKKWAAKGYHNVKCKLQKSDTRGLRMYVVVAEK